eukprot:9787715-Lingulodinium_polyedra.AAC.1
MAAHHSFLQDPGRDSGFTFVLEVCCASGIVVAIANGVGVGLCIGISVHIEVSPAINRCTPIALALAMTFREPF